MAVPTSSGTTLPSARWRRGLQHRELDRLVVDEAVGHALTDGLEGGDRAVELLAVDRCTAAVMRIAGRRRPTRSRTARPSCAASVQSRISRPVARRRRAARRRRRAHRRARGGTGARGCRCPGASSVMPAASVGTRNSATSSSTVAGTSIVRATSKYGTHDLHAVDAPAVAVGLRRRRRCVGRREQLGECDGEHGRARGHAVEQSPAARRCRTRRSAARPTRARGTSGSGATARPTSWSSRHESRKPKPPPPCASGNATPSRSALASSAHVSRSNQSVPASTSFRCCSVMRSPRIWPVPASSAPAASR